MHEWDICGRSLSRFTDSIYTVYTGDKPKPNVNSDAQIVPLPCWLLSLAWKPSNLKDKHRDLLNYFYSSNLALPASPLEGRGRSYCSGMPGSRKWPPGPGPRRPRESGWWCGSWPATSREPRSIRHTQPLTDPRTICRGRLGRYVHAPPAVQWVQTLAQRRRRLSHGFFPSCQSR